VAGKGTKLTIDSGFEEFLSNEPVLRRLVREAAERLPAYFPETSMRVELRHDPKWPAPPELVLAVVTALPLTEAFTRMEQFDDDWWLDAMPNADGLLDIASRRP
jgi:hypothetical protein